MTEPSTTQRDELAEIRDITAAVIAQPIAIPQDLWPEQIALALNAAGYRKSRTIAVDAASREQLINTLWPTEAPRETSCSNTRTALTTAEI